MTTVKVKPCERCGHHTKEPMPAEWILVTGCIHGHIDVRYFCDNHWTARRFSKESGHRPLCRPCWDGVAGHKPGYIHHVDDFIAEHI